MLPNYSPSVYFWEAKQTVSPPAITCLLALILYTIGHMTRVSLTMPGQFQSLTGWTPSAVAIAFVNLIMVLAGIAFVFSLFIGGFKIILAAGDKDKTGKAVRQITHAFIGLFIVLGTYALVQLASMFFGIPLLQFSIISIT